MKPIHSHGRKSWSADELFDNDYSIIAVGYAAVPGVIVRRWHAHRRRHVVVKAAVLVIPVAPCHVASRHSALHRSTARCNWLQHVVTQHSTLSVARRNCMQPCACNTAQRSTAWQRSAHSRDDEQRRVPFGRSAQVFVHLAAQRARGGATHTWQRNAHVAA
jgi:hypothetical protein